MVDSPSLFWRLKRQKYNLIGTQCITCNDLFFPPKNFCPFCRRKGKIVDKQFSGKGEIISYTVIRAAPQGFEIYAPYTVALIKLEEGPTISGQVVANGKSVEIGVKVMPTFRRMYEDGSAGQIHYGLKWYVV